MPSFQQGNKQDLFINQNVGSRNKVPTCAPTNSVFMCLLVLELSSSGKTPESAFLLLYLEFDREQSHSVMEHGFFPIDFNINGCYFSDIVSNLGNLFIKNSIFLSLQLRMCGIEVD